MKIYNRKIKKYNLIKLFLSGKTFEKKKIKG